MRAGNNLRPCTYVALIFSFYDKGFLHGVRVYLVRFTSDVSSFNSPSADVFVLQMTVFNIA